ncbi:protoporphyrinogen oxidase [Parafrigoribacterium mesophilum]|uniref:protoporphyrinogen/coproporphyrinogen oxidase n=1 Tax=Parafrigoribacterium mesophilum TaxID=433646 RepID=UPI0031FDFA0A
MPMPRVIVVGGGIAGLVAARELATGGFQVTLLEAAAMLGGRVARHTVAGIDLDAGAESFATRGGTVAAFVTELGMADAIVEPNHSGAWLQPADRDPLPLPKTGLFGIPGTPLAKDVIAVTGLAGALRAELDVLLPFASVRDGQSLGDLVRKRMGPRVLDSLVAPVVLGIHSRHPDELAVDRVAPGLRKAIARTGSLSRAVLSLRAAAPAGSAVAGIDGGIYRIVEALAADLHRRGVNVRTGTSVAAVSAGAVDLADGGVLTADHVVLATRLESPPARKIVLATLVVDAAALDAAPRGTGLLVAPGAAGIRAKALTHASAKWAWLAEKAGPHRHVLRLSYNGAPEHGLDDIARTDAQRLLGVPITAAQVAGFAQVSWPGPAVGSAVGAPDGVTQVGEAVAGTGLAAGISFARQACAELLAGSRD